MKPYYQDAAVTLYHGDCREVLPKLDRADLMLTDPPYGLSERWQGGTWGAAAMYADARKWDIRVEEELIAAAIDKGRTAIVWGANHYTMPPCRGFLAWIKRNSVPTMADLEIAWTTLDRPAKFWLSGVNPDGKRMHPTEKPLGLMLWCIKQVECAQILDPFAGSGTTLRAAKDLGRKAIGIEIEERYCEIAARRCQQEVIDFSSGRLTRPTQP